MDVSLGYSPWPTKAFIFIQVSVGLPYIPTSGMTQWRATEKPNATGGVYMDKRK